MIKVGEKELIFSWSLHDQVSNLNFRILLADAERISCFKLDFLTDGKTFDWITSGHLGHHIKNDIVVDILYDERVDIYISNISDCEFNCISRMDDSINIYGRKCDDAKKIIETEKYLTVEDYFNSGDE